jgi:hypothetical protein
VERTSLAEPVVTGIVFSLRGTSRWLSDAFRWVDVAALEDWVKATLIWWEMEDRQRQGNDEIQGSFNPLRMTT